MKLALLLCLMIGLCSMARADRVVLKNGDHLTGAIAGSDNKELRIKTDYAAEIKVQWTAVQELTSDGPLVAVTANKETISGPVHLEGMDLVMATAGGERRIPLSRLSLLRSPQDHQAYEKSLHPGFTDDWKGGVNLGFALARGNSNTTNLNLGFTSDRKTLSDEIAANASSVYSTNGTVNGHPGEVTANEILGSARYSHNLNRLVFGFVSGDFTHDALQDLNLRQIYTGGIGWHTITNPNTTLDVLLGVNYTRESYSAGAAGGTVGRNLPGLTAGENFMHKFGAGTTFTEDLDFYPDLSDLSQYRFAFDAGVVTKLGKWLGWQASTSDRYVTNPPILGTKSNDFILSTGFNIAFAQ